MPFCEFCGEEIGYLPFRCNYCGGTFCKQHRLPENHECTFELKHKPVVPTTPKRTRQQDQKPKHTASKDYLEKGPKELKKYLKRQEKQRERARKIYTNSTRGQFRRGAPSNYIGTTVLIWVIIVFILISLFFDWYGLSLYIYFSLHGFIFQFAFHTIITALFIVPPGGPLGIFFIFIMLYFLNFIAKNIEMRFGTKFFFKLYVICCLFTALFYVVLRLLLHFTYPIDIFYVPMGMAMGGILGLIAFSIFPIMNQEITTLMLFIPIKMKGKTFLIVLVALRLIPGLIEATYNPVSLLYYLPELGGILGAYLVYKFRVYNR